MKTVLTSKTHKAVIALLIGLLASTVEAQISSQSVMTNTTVEAMVHGGVSVPIIIQAIKTATDVDFLTN
jgi:hypothetical protein